MRQPNSQPQPMLPELEGFSHEDLAFIMNVYECLKTLLNTYNLNDEILDIKVSSPINFAINLASYFKAKNLNSDNLLSAMQKEINSLPDWVFRPRGNKPKIL